MISKRNKRFLTLCLFSYLGKQCINIIILI